MASRDAVDLLILGALWGASFLFMRIAAPEFGPIPLIFVRVAIAAMLLALVLWHRGLLTVLVRQQRPLIVLGVINTAVPFTLFAYAALTLPAGLNSVLNATVPLFGAVTAAVWLGERLGPARLAGLALGFGGVLVLAWPTLAIGGQSLAVLAALTATVLYGISAHYARRSLAGVASMAVAGGSQLAAAAVLAPLALARWPATPPSLQAWACALALGVLCTALAYVLYFRLIVRTGAVTAMAVTYLIPVFGIGWGAVFLAERLPVSAFAGALLVLLGVALATHQTGAHTTAS